MVERPDACAAFAHALGEPLPGTAPLATGWLCVEDCGPWGRDALLDGTLSDAVTSAVQARLGPDVRFQAIRRSPRPTGVDRTVVLAHGGDRPWMRSLRLSDDQIADLDPTVTLDPTPPPFGDEVTDPAVLVCTHGKRDACCAERGRPVATALLAAAGDVTWETSHTGGHRFAPSLIVLPTGAVHGHVTLADAARIVAAARIGQIHLPTFRGRAATSRAAQAAEVHVRRADDLRSATDVRVVGEEDVDGTAVRVHLAVGVDDVAVLVDRVARDARPVSCGAEPTSPTGWEVRAVGPG